MALLTDLQRQEFTSSYPEWRLAEGSISRRFELDTFSAAIGFVMRVALAAERADHHPDIDLRWNTVTLTLTTHSEGGLTQGDVDLAATITALI